MNICHEHETLTLFDLVVCVPEMLETKDGEDEKGTSMIPTPRGKEVRHVDIT